MYLDRRYYQGSIDQVCLSASRPASKRTNVIQDVGSQLRRSRPVLRQSARPVVIISRVPLLIVDILLIYITWTNLGSRSVMRNIRLSDTPVLSDILFHNGTFHSVTTRMLQRLTIICGRWSHRKCLLPVRPFVSRCCKLRRASAPIVFSPQSYLHPEFLTSHPLCDRGELCSTLIMSSLKARTDI